MMKTVLALGLLAALATPDTAYALNIQAPSEPKLKVTKMQMGIKSPAVSACPAEAKLNVWVFTNKEGTVPVYIARASGQVAGPFNVTTKKLATGVYVGTYSRDLAIHQPIDARYRASVPSHKQLSNWVPLKASCSFGLGG
ncbi:MAG: hypothetical protein ABJL55_11000 [Roseibium sp.]